MQSAPFPKFPNNPRCQNSRATMEPSIKLLAALVLLCAAVYKFFIYPAFLSPLSKIPAANFTARFSPLWMHYIRYTQQENETTYRLHKKHGPVVCTGPNELSVNCYDGLKTIYGGNFDKHDFYVRRFSNFGYVNSYLEILRNCKPVTLLTGRMKMDSSL